MKKGLLPRFIILAVILAGFSSLESCRKAVADEPVAVQTTADKSSEAVDGISALQPEDIIGAYSVRGSRTVYFGQADANGDNVYLHLDYRADKKIDTLLRGKALTCAYGDSKYVSLGWQYIIRYNKKKNTILLSPNDAMAAAIVPNSFETRDATYNPRRKEFSFRTRFTSPEDKNEVEIFEVLTAE